VPKLSASRSGSALSTTGMGVWPTSVPWRITSMTTQPSSNRVEAAARALAADLEHTVPTRLDGEGGWYAVAERALIAADRGQS
jgi:hypothetical protein